MSRCVLPLLSARRHARLSTADRQCRWLSSPQLKATFLSSLGNGDSGSAASVPAATLAMRAINVARDLSGAD